MQHKIITREVEKLFDRFPLYSQDGKGDAARVLVKVFNPYGGQSWYVLEAGEKQADGDRELFTLFTCGGEAEYGYTMLSDLTKTRVRVTVWGHTCLMPFERDKWFKGNVADAKRDAGIAA